MQDLIREDSAMRMSGLRTQVANLPVTESRRPMIHSSLIYMGGSRLLGVFTLVALCVAGHSALADDASRIEPASDRVSAPLAAGDHIRSLTIDETVRTAIVHVPKKYDPDRPAPLVLALHGAAMTGEAMEEFTKLNVTSEDKGFVVVYPDGTGKKPLLTWNAGSFANGVGSQADDLGFLNQLLDDVETVVNVDKKRIYACGMSNGGMMCYRLAAELSKRIAAIAPVAGTMAIGDARPSRPVSVMHFHGTADALVPFEAESGKSHFWLRTRSVADSISAWRKLDGCLNQPPRVDVLSKPDDELEVVRSVYGPGTANTEVVLIKIVGGGHTWPGELPPVKFLGKSSLSVSANELMWAFFEKHHLN